MANFSNVAMVGGTAAVILLTLLPTLISCSGEGNIRLLEDEVAGALKACSEGENPRRESQKQRRSADGPSRIDDGKSSANQYSHERRNTTDVHDQMFIINSTDYDYEGYGSAGGGKKLVNSMPRTAAGGSYQSLEADGNNFNRTRRSEPLFSKADNDQCLSQCVFANLQVVDSRGIPREAELWSTIQTAVTSQQSRAALRDQIGSCFQELQSEAEDNGCSYSNKLERCLMLRFSDRKPQATETAAKT